MGGACDDCFEGNQKGKLWRNGFTYAEGLLLFVSQIYLISIYFTKKYCPAKQKDVYEKDKAYVISKNKETPHIWLLHGFCIITQIDLYQNKHIGLKELTGRYKLFDEVTKELGNWNFPN